MRAAVRPFIEGAQPFASANTTVHGPDWSLFPRRARPEMIASMPQSILHVALLVKDYDEAIAFFVDKLGFGLIEDTYQPEQDKRWVVVAPAGTGGTNILLARATTPAQVACVGQQAGGRVLMFLRTDDFWRDYNRMMAAEVRFVRDPKEQPYGTVAVFEDLYGNLWDLIQPAS